MFGRTYALGYEQDLEQTLIHRPRGRVQDPGLPWAIWYPLRRAGAIEGLSAQEQRVILMEHGGVGRSYGRAGYGYDIRLACYGLDKNYRRAYAQDQTDVHVSGTAGPFLHRPGRLAE